MAERPVASPLSADALTAPADADRTASGLRHAVLRAAASERRAAAHDRARVSFRGYDSAGQVIDDTQRRGGVVEVAVDQGFPGFREALAVLREGEKRRFWIPEELAYKHYPGAVRGALVYDIELVAVVPRPAPPPVPDDVAAPPPGAASGPRGARYRVLQAGFGKRRAQPASGVDVHYTCWTPRGELVRSTIPSGMPYRADLKYRDLMFGFVDALQSMVVGETRRLWLPATLTTSANDSLPTQPLVCDLQLVALYENKVLVESMEPR